MEEEEDELIVYYLEKDVCLMKTVNSGRNDTTGIDRNQAFARNEGGNAKYRH